MRFLLGVAFCIQFRVDSASVRNANSLVSCEEHDNSCSSVLCLILTGSWQSDATGPILGNQGILIMWMARLTPSWRAGKNSLTRPALWLVRSLRTTVSRIPEKSESTHFHPGHWCQKFHHEGLKLSSNIRKPVSREIPQWAFYFSGKGGTRKRIGGSCSQEGGCPPYFGKHTLKGGSRVTTGDFANFTVLPKARCANRTRCGS